MGRRGTNTSAVDHTRRTTKTLAAFLLRKELEQCPICRLPAGILRQIETRDKSRVMQSTVLQWLKEDCGVTITADDWRQHRRKQHRTRKLNLAVK